MENRKVNHLPAQRLSDVSGPGAEEAIVPGSPVSSSGVGLCGDVGAGSLAHDSVPIRLREAIACVLDCLEDKAPHSYIGQVHRATRAVIAYVNELSLFAINLERDRRNLTIQIKQQEDLIRVLSSPGKYERLLRGCD